MPKPFRLVIVTDAWRPQVNGVVRTLMNTAACLESMGVEVNFITPALFRTLPCPSYPEIRLAITGSRRIEQMIQRFKPDALHIATEGPLGWAARRAALRNGWTFTTAYHTRFPEYVHARTRLPMGWLYAVMRRFHAPATSVLAPTQDIIDDLKFRGFANVAYWTRGVDHKIFFPRIQQSPPDAANPIFLYAGRIAVEKNIEAFLSLDLPGEKWVAGDGPLMADLKRRYRDVRWIGVVTQHELAMLYSQADVFVFPSKTDTFGLVMVEAMACGLPVAAFPVAGPRDVVGESGAGVLDEDLRSACLRCLEIPRTRAIERAGAFTWQAATQQLLRALQPMRAESSSPPPNRFQVIAAAKANP
jgi:glycosyltransferase involved in cell wall biosynthesis